MTLNFRTDPADRAKCLKAIQQVTCRLRKFGMLQAGKLWDRLVAQNGWRLSADTVINRQKATVDPITFTASRRTVWECDALPFTIMRSGRRPVSRTFWVEFDDFVDAPVADYAPYAAVRARW
jgi:hypothetical protein